MPRVMGMVISGIHFTTLCTSVICNVSTLTSTVVLQDGWSPLKSSCFEGHLDVVKTLIEAGANINQANKVSTHIPAHHSL